MYSHRPALRPLSLLRISAPCLHRFGHGTVSPSKLVGAMGIAMLLQSTAWCSRGLFASVRTPVPPVLMSATSTPSSDLLQLNSMALPLLEAASNQVMLPGDAVTITLPDAPKEWTRAIDHSIQSCDGAAFRRKNWLEWRLALLAEAGQEPEAAGGTIRCRNQQLEHRLIEDSAPFFSRAGLVGQLLCMNKATHNNGFTVASWLPVLRVVEARRQGGAGADSSEAQLHKVKLVCIGRARLHHSSGLATAEAGHAFNAAPLAEYADAPLQRDELDTAYRYVHAHTHTLLPALVPIQVHRPMSLGAC